MNTNSVQNVRKLKRWNGAVTELRTAHEVRKLCACACGGLAWRDRSIAVEITRESSVHYHGRCYIARHGLAAFLALPRTQLDGLTLGDIGPRVMRKVLG